MTRNISSALSICAFLLLFCATCCDHAAAQVTLLILDETEPQILTGSGGTIVLPGEDVNVVATLNGTDLTVPGDLDFELQKLDAGALTGFLVLDQSRVTVSPSTLMPQIRFHNEDIGDIVGFRTFHESSVLHEGNTEVSNIGNGSAFFALAFDNSEITLDGVSSVSQSGNGRAHGILSAGSATVHVTGQMTVIDEGNNSAELAAAAEDSHITIDGFGELIETGPGLVRALSASENARIDYRGDFTMTQEGPGDAVLLSGFGNSHITVAGDLVITSTGPDLNVIPINLEDNARLDILSGRLAIFGGDFFVGQTIGVSDSSEVYWSGGMIDFGNRDPFFGVNDTARLVIDGYGFNRPLGVVDDEAGRIEGTLSDGSPFAIDFGRTEGAIILLVPEPSAICACSIAMLMLVRQRFYRTVASTL